MTLFLKWWLMLMIICAGLIIVVKTGALSLILTADFTRLSLIILALFFGLSAYCGVLCYRFCKAIQCGDYSTVQTIKQSIDTGWLGASTCSRIGLVGTVIGFILMVGGLATLDPSDLTSMQEVVASMSAGIGVALYTTLVGQSCNILLTIQYFMLSQAVRKEFDE